MRRNSLHQCNGVYHWVMLAVLFGCLCTSPVWMAGCGKEEPAAPVPEKAVEAPAAPVETVDGPDAPVTLKVLRLMPESTVLAWAFPTIDTVFQTGATLAKRYMPPEQVDATLSKWVADLAATLETPGAQTYGEIARQRGFDPDAPVAVFGNLDQIAANFEQAAARAKERKEKDAQAVKTAETAPPAETPPAVTPPADESGAPAADAPLTVKAPAPDYFDEALKAAMREKLPELVMVWKALDVAVAENSLKELAASNLLPIKVTEEQTVEAAGTTIHTYDNARFAYAIVGDRVFAATSVPMLEESLARLSAPADIRYGTARMPSLRRDEIVVLGRMDRVMAFIKRVTPPLATSGADGAEYAQMQLQALDLWASHYTSPDPMVATITVMPAEDDKPPTVIVRGRADLKQQTALAEALGEIRPLRLAPLMPAATQLVIAQQFNTQSKEFIKKQWVDSLPPEARDQAQTDQALAIMNQVLDNVNDELALGVAPTEAGLPGIYLLAGLTNPEQAKTIIGGFAPTSPAEEYNGVQILKVMHPIPMITINMAFAGNDMLVGTDLPAMKEILDRLQGRAQPVLFAGLQPPLDPAVPRQAFLMANTQIIADVVTPLSGFAGGLGEAQKPADMVSKVLRELRVSSEVKDQIYDTGIVVYLK